MNKMISDRYMIVTSLGEGGMADVYLAIDTILNREVAIKILRGELSNDPVTLLRFQREANAASKLNHPNVVDVYDVGVSNGRHYIVMEYVRGRTLKQLISQRGALHKEEAVDIMLQVTSAVQHAHANNIIHRDIKPQNVLVKDDGTIKITDFGIALAHDAVQLTQSDAVLGSAHYLAPETTRGEPASNQIDIYALGVVFYELLTGSVPFRGDNPVQIAMKHLREEIPSVRSFNPTLPQSIENIIIKATVKNRKLRYASAQDLLDDLEKCLLLEYEDVEKLVLIDHNPSPTMTLDDMSDVQEEKKVEEIKEEIIEEKRNRHSKSIIGGLLVLIGVVVVVGGIYFTGIFSGFSYDKSIVIPDIMKMSQEEAKVALLNAGFDEDDITYIEAVSDDGETGDVFECSPAIGEKAKKSQGIKLSISTGTYYVLPDFVGKNISEVEKTIKEKAPKLEIIIEKSTTADKKAGTILAQSGFSVGDKIDPNKAGKLTLKVVYAPEVMIEGILGMPIADAQKKLTDAGVACVTSEKLPLGMSEEELAALSKGVVVEVDPPEGTKFTQDSTNKVITLYYYK